MSVLDEAMKLLEMNPPPYDIERRFDDLEAMASPDELPLFEDLRCTLFQILNK